MITLHVDNLVGGSITVTTGPAGHPETRVTYTSESGYADWSGEIEGELGKSSIPNINNIKTLDIGTSVTSIGYDTFYDCFELTDVIIPDTVTSIGSYAFQRCGGLTNIVIGNNVTSIGSFAFDGCINLTNLTIPRNVINIGNQAFYSTSNMISIVFQGKTLEQVQNIEDNDGNKQYPWGITDTSIISVA